MYLRGPCAVRLAPKEAHEDGYLAQTGGTIISLSWYPAFLFKLLSLPPYIFYPSILQKLKSSSSKYIRDTVFQQERRNCLLNPVQARANVQCATGTQVGDAAKACLHFVTSHLAPEQAAAPLQSDTKQRADLMFACLLGSEHVRPASSITVHTYRGRSWEKEGGSLFTMRLLNSAINGMKRATLSSCASPFAKVSRKCSGYELSWTRVRL